MRQLVHEVGPNGSVALEIPSASAQVMAGVRWGAYDVVLTPAYWRYQVWLCDVADGAPPTYALGRTLTEEVAACLLGGYGIPAEVGLAALARLQALGLLSGRGPCPSHDDFMEALRAPLIINGRPVRYRFIGQKSRYLSQALPRLVDAPVPKERDPADTKTAAAHRSFREWLCTLPGVGYKTASWVTRNWLASDAVAIIDIHLYRACVLANVFESTADITRDYVHLEQRFLRFATALGTSAARLDAVIWRDMRWLSAHARQQLARPTRSTVGVQGVLRH